jgi:peptide/nickel transport system substrate-binding protein
MTRRGLLATATLIAAMVDGIGNAQAATPGGEFVIAPHITVPAAWFDPAEMGGASLLELYALHDALMKPMPGGTAAPCLSDSHSVSADGLRNTFVLRAGITFHNGMPVTAPGLNWWWKRSRNTGANRRASRN